ncbi:MAG: hypothetical protein IIU15_00695 [Treponema sp.]|nr:hypothetical protein [Treponema sp.]
MKIRKSSKIIFPILAASIFAVSCSKKAGNVVENDPTVDSSKIVTGKIEVETPSESYSNLTPTTTQTDEFDAFVNDIGTKIGDATTGTLDLLNGAIDSIKDSSTISTITDALTSTVDMITNPDTYTGAIDSIKNSVGESAKETVSSITESVTESVKNSDVVTGITDTVSSAAENLGGSLGIDSETQDALNTLGGLLNFGKKN